MTIAYLPQPTHWPDGRRRTVGGPFESAYTYRAVADSVQAALPAKRGPKGKPKHGPPLAGTLSLNRRGQRCVPLAPKVAGAVVIDPRPQASQDRQRAIRKASI